MMLLAANPSASFTQRRQHNPFSANDAFSALSSWDNNHNSVTTTSASPITSSSVTAPAFSSAAASSSTSAPALALSPADASFSFTLDEIARFQQDSIAAQSYMRNAQQPQSSWSQHSYHRSAPTTAPRSNGPQQQQQATRRSVGGESQGNLTPTNWQTFSNHSPVATEASPVQQQPTVKRFGPLAGHKRSNSGSTIASAGPASPFTPLQSYPHIHDPESHYGSPLIDNFGDLSPSGSNYGKPLHSGTSTTFTDSYLTPPTYYSQHADPNLAYQAAMRRAMMIPQDSSHGSNDGSGSPVAGLQRQQTGEFDRNFRATVDARYQEEMFDQNTPQQPARRSITSASMATATTGGGSGNVVAMAGDRTSPYRMMAADRMQTVAQLREQQKAASDAYAFAQHRQRTSPRMEEPKTISPQEAFLEQSEMDAAEYGPSLFAHAHQSFAPASLQRGHSSQASVGTPEFPAQLTSMESTRSEERTPGSSSSSSFHSSQQHQTTPLARPPYTAADAGSYACPQPGCTSRFTTAAKLQKHQRDAHRPVTPPLDGSVSGNESGLQHSPRATAAMLAARNAQAGPHKCDRTNPATGRPCNAIFSRPYDLTRHEDTIHNSRRHKVRCPFCADEKTFSRADALTRHLRVVHPERDVPGRRRRM